ncbi:hypothetical protein A3C21_03825 [Candidatus Kaiserbacteria bacterium RIFCSPHIGHO2_02_FULL_59_21]|uniref:Uncharacterized protein n=1 Tax=Candidatus Kaiserbacteria bacterium RIFCSPHIGHO2_02_FULL_59_21 TaxID=1798500 RepID=A0A1F6E1L6_9BACT|nr:MAG: hypothetical protein A2766_02315 [Candidatus Kaiserbacteria bacterium RIFCSPHIGHO2_01_FULL_58_22]OGG67579.1 MAG: hypothetical protein A3C21_03825 [Candidatus Kaiserbacteria bacterium RIFCSPHIGHO2_02_FULL_59_21]OGG80649.1 MAG: hypothetical protein A2952_02480 [Candidatus Kaiserbacteria bacterium RIFCSPLOWO2_01_FULL_59_34]OGG85432.1 MAG: hypothetical protein A3I47_03660 [Candidatus Kaiserbacteria bacterium RIFCSPLOWO2_02_FULL_59_19]
MAMDDKFPGSAPNVRKLDKGRDVGSKVRISRDKLDKYVRNVHVDQKHIETWKQKREEAKHRGEEDRFLEKVPHPKAEFIRLPDLSIVEKQGGKYRLALYESSSTWVWVDPYDVEDATPTAASSSGSVGREAIEAENIMGQDTLAPSAPDEAYGEEELKQHPPDYYKHK